MSIHSFLSPSDEWQMALSMMQLQMAYWKCLVVSVLVNTIDDVWGLRSKT